MAAAARDATQELRDFLKATESTTVGILICGGKNEHTVRYSLGRVTTPMTVASHTYDALPAEVHQDLPDTDRLTAALTGPKKQSHDRTQRRRRRRRISRPERLEP